MNYKISQRKADEALKPRMVEPSQPENMITVGPKVVLVNRRAARDNQKNPHPGSKPNFKHVVNDYGLQRELSQDPNMSNHARLMLRRGQI